VDTQEEKGRKAIRGAFFGFFVDMFDIYLPVIVLAPAIKYFVAPELSDAQTSLITGAIFAATLIGRPIGALIFGHHADRLAQGVGVDAVGDAGRDLALEDLPHAAGELDDLEPALHLTQRVREHLAVLVGDQLGQLLGMAIDQFPEGEQDLRPLAHC